MIVELSANSSHILKKKLETFMCKRLDIFLNNNNINDLSLDSHNNILHLML